MSADLFLVFYGLRVHVGNWEDKSIDDEKIEQLESGEHPLIVSAKSVGLDTLWSSFGIENYLLFIGKKIGIFGVEYSFDKGITNDELQASAVDVKTKLTEAGIEGEPKLWMQFHPDM